MIGGTRRGNRSRRSLGRHLWWLLVAALLGAALGVIRPVRCEIVPRSAHVIHAQILLAIVGAMNIIVVAESLARAFAIVGAAGLVRYRARIDDPKDAGVMLVALAVGSDHGQRSAAVRHRSLRVRHRGAVGARVGGTGSAFDDST